ncbi:amidohydrolase [Stenotrophomonas terrae]|uniref:Amidohydrolase n=1 Tax=Stenotrophomonas terrae TaxID=405446 RepID=A0A0R0CXD7_9GAMM|nr:amidohydrolase [Stenotrophomonas terrae]KRG69752.1 amidohydrolase [Stenotrophomonas terrae]
MRRIACVALLLPCLHALPALAEVKLLLADTIRTGDAAQPVAGAMAWDSDTGRVLQVGSAEALRKAYPKAAALELGDATVVPGLIDAHAHIMGLGNTLMQADLTGARNRGEVVERLKAFEKTLAPGEWLLGRGWDQNRWDNTDFPTVADLDAAFPQRPLYLERVDGHAGWVNSAAIRVAERAGNSLSGDWQPEGGRILRNADGTPSGVLVDGAAALVYQYIPALDDASREKRLQAALQAAVSNGLTGVHDMGVSREDLALMKRLADQGELPLRIDAYADGNNEALEDLCKAGLYAHPGGRLEMRGVKLYMDGALGSRGAALLTAYSDDPHNHGLLMTSPEEFEVAVRKADGCKVQVATHAIGDRGNRIVLDTYEKVLGAHKGDDHRWRIEHSQVVALDDIPRFAKLGVIASMQPTHATSDMGWAEQRVGPERILGAYAWQRFLHSGARLALGSDFPVEQVDPRLGLYAAVTRQDRDGQPPGGWQPEQRLSAAEALRGFTSDAAWAGHDEAQVGKLQRGLRADFVVLDRDPLKVAADQLDDLKVLSTWVDGEPVYKAATPEG